ncbi:Tyrosinase domain-containing protein [Paramicrosporidium saccamoebae]|uniref:Tyrosinase domain-containing protein n=1 Tax=Paramicrosporidium saccamoebae TaxID=1246581 RepID=A0A2H9TP87_9FUNG|nr:Tyrosinase domain-containing protein [Paramicrosporidium saccamoebae]
MRIVPILYGLLGSGWATVALIDIKKCTRQVVRKEFRDMNTTDWNRFKDALLTLQTTPSPNTNYTEWDDWTRIHIDNMHLAHGSNLFFPWHRAYVLALENRLQQIDASIAIPFWDWTFDWAIPLNSPIFSPEYGLDVKPGPSGDCRYRRRLYEPHCLVRDYNASEVTPYFPPESVSAVISSERNYTSFRELIEMVPHGLVHTSLGGATGDMSEMNSPNDPIFFLHHSMVDYIWWIWQQTTGGRMEEYGGDKNQILEPFGVTVSNVMDVSKLCYTYQPFSRNYALIPSATKLRTRRRVRNVRIWKVSQSWLEMNHISLERLQQIVDRFNRLSGRR